MAGYATATTYSAMTSQRCYGAGHAAVRPGKRRPSVLGRGRDSAGRGGREPLRRHPPTAVPAAANLGDRPVPEGRIRTPHRLAQTPPGPITVPVRAVQRLDRPGHHDRGSLLRL